MSKFDKALEQNLVYYKNGPIEELLKIMDEDIAEEKKEIWKYRYIKYEKATKEEVEKYKKECLFPKVDSPILIIFEDKDGLARFGCYSGNIMRNGQKIYTDEFGKEYCLDELGNRIVPSYSKIDSEPGEFTTHDTSQGHCGLCGNIACNGGCFK